MERARVNCLHDPKNVFVDSNGTIFVLDCLKTRLAQWKEGTSEGFVIGGFSEKNLLCNHLNFLLN